VSAEVDLATAYDFSKAGEYTIEFLSPSISHVAKTEAEMAKTLDDLGPVQMPSNKVTTRIAKSSSTGPSTQPIPNKGVESSITLIGTVMDASPSARIVMLKEPVEGYRVIALTEESELTFLDGVDVALRDVQPGMTIQASGQPGESNALLASQVLVLQATPDDHNPQQQSDAGSKKP
jgi:hypothetical protein